MIITASATATWLIIVQSTNPENIYTATLQPSKPLSAVTVRNSHVIAMREPADINTPLLLFLPATGANTDIYTMFEQTAAASGYHVIAMPYANLRTERSICLSNTACYGDVRAEQLSGTPSGYLPQIAQAAAIKMSLPSALTQLAHQDPSGQWGRYMKAGMIDWSNIVVAGHSQGGGLAAYIAHQTVVKGVIMFSSPNDTFPRTQAVADWLKSPNATPPSRYYGFYDTHDSYAASTTTAWGTMLPGISIAKSDNVQTLQGQLLSTAVIHFPDRLTAHFAVVRDGAYRPVWNYLLEKNQ